MRELVTTLLEVVALLLLAAAAGLAFAPFSTAAGCAAAGVVLLGASWLVARKGDR